MTTRDSEFAQSRPLKQQPGGQGPASYPRLSQPLAYLHDIEQGMRPRRLPLLPLLPRAACTHAGLCRRCKLLPGWLLMGLVLKVIVLHVEVRTATMRLQGQQLT